MQETKPDSPPVADNPSPAGQSHGLASPLGRWAHAHRDFFRGKTGDIAARTALGSAIAWVPTIASFALTRAAWEKYEAYASRHAQGVMATLGKPFLSKEFPVGRHIGFIFSGWFTYRTAARMYYRAYDRLFAAKDAAEATRTIRNTPGNLLKDFKEILPGGIAEETVGAFVLGGVKAALVPAGNFLDVRKGDWKAARKGYLGDLLATTVAYSAFTEVCDHIYPGIAHGKDSPEYYRKLKGLPDKVDVPPEQKKFGFFTEDGAGRMLFRTTGSVLFGFAAYIAGQRSVRASIGVPTLAESALGAIVKNYAKDYAAWVPFSAYAVISQVYKEQYDALFDRLEKKEAGRAV